jgi:hypothetical protein
MNKAGGKKNKQIFGGRYEKINRFRNGGHNVSPDS